MTPFTRSPHATLNLDSRRLKGMKIERLLELKPAQNRLRVLEIGTGSGGIAHYFSHHPSLDCDVKAIDVIDQRQATDGYTFQTVNDTELPFTDGSFDVVISNHVIEHVGDRAAQLHHLQEIRRVLAADGTGYIAMPNRWMVVEPHYQLPLLSWLPSQWRDHYLRLTGKGLTYDCLPMSKHELDVLVASCDLAYEHIEVRAFRLMLDLEGTRTLTGQIARWIPDALLMRLLPVFPTLICRLTHPI